MSQAHRLARAASDAYRPSGRFAYYFALGKLTHDPVFEAILSRGLLTRQARILDLGCGQGLLASWLRAAAGLARQGEWPVDWPPAPQIAAMRGIDLAPQRVIWARAAVGEDASFIVGDVRRADFGSVDGVVILDVLHYIEYADQRAILERVKASLTPGGVLLIRVADPGSGFGFRLGKWVDQMVLLMSGQGIRPLHCRSIPEWRELLACSGFDSEIVPMSDGTPFANVLLVARPH